MKEKLFSVTLKDCKVEAMRSSKGAGGQHRDKTSSAIRVTHEPSGAVGFSQEYREQPRNKKLAFKRMSESLEFQLWCKDRARPMQSVDEIVDKLMQPDNILIEYLGGSSTGERGDVAP